MPKAPRSAVLTELREMKALLHEHELAIKKMRDAFDVQFTRTAQMQAELDLISTARKRRDTVRVSLHLPPAHNGNGRSHP